jgi:hypothetical protein
MNRSHAISFEATNAGSEQVSLSLDESRHGRTVYLFGTNSSGVDADSSALLRLVFLVDIFPPLR